MLARELPDGEQRGLLTFVRNWCDYVEFASLASAHGLPGFGDSAFTVSCPVPNVTLTPPGGDGANHVSPTPAGIVAHASDIYHEVSGELGSLTTFYSEETPHSTPPFALAGGWCTGARQDRAFWVFFS